MGSSKLTSMRFTSSYYRINQAAIPAVLTTDSRRSVDVTDAISTLYPDTGHRQTGTDRQKFAVTQRTDVRLFAYKDTLEGLETPSLRRPLKYCVLHLLG